MYFYPREGSGTLHQDTLTIEYAEHGPITSVIVDVHLTTSHCLSKDLGENICTCSCTYKLPSMNLSEEA